MRVLSLGAGVQSTALLLMSDRGDIDRADYAIFADTGAEPKAVYEWLDFITDAVSIPVIKCSSGNLYEDIVNGGRFASIPFYTSQIEDRWVDDTETSFSECEEEVNRALIEGASVIEHEDGLYSITKKIKRLIKAGSEGMVKRQCTFEYKIAPIIKKTRELAGYKPRQRIKEKVEMLIGISLDETYRMKSSSEKWISNRWPLVEKRMSRGDCIKYVENVLGKTPPRSSCLFCPFHNDKEWLHVKNGPADEWQKVIEVEKKLQSLERFTAQAFLHPSRKPIETVDFYDGKDQLDLFGNECEGMCGV